MIMLASLRCQVATLNLYQPHQMLRPPITPFKTCSLITDRYPDMTLGTQPPVHLHKMLTGLRRRIMGTRVIWGLHHEAREMWKTILKAAMNIAEHTTQTIRVSAQVYLLMHAARLKLVQDHHLDNGQLTIIPSGVTHTHIRKLRIQPRHQTVTRLQPPRLRATLIRAPSERLRNDPGMKTVRQSTSSSIAVSSDRRLQKRQLPSIGPSPALHVDESCFYQSNARHDIHAPHPAQILLATSHQHHNSSPLPSASQLSRNTTALHFHLFYVLTITSPFSRI